MDKKLGGSIPLCTLEVELGSFKDLPFLKYRVFHKSCNQKCENLAKKKKKKKQSVTLKYVEWQH